MVKSLVHTHGYAKLHLTREVLVSKHTHTLVVDCQAASCSLGLQHKTTCSLNHHNFYHYKQKMKQRKRLAHAVHEIKQMHEHYINILDGCQLYKQI